MRKYVLAIAVLFSSFVTVAQTTDAGLNERLDEYMRLTRALKFEEIMNYMHPKIFSLASKEQLIEVFKQSFDNEEISIAFDSTAITGVSENFTFENVIYKKIDYSADMSVIIKDTASINDENFITIMKMAFTNAFPGSTVEFNKPGGKFEIKASSIMFAIKDSASTPWMFLGYEKKNEALVEMLYPKEVLEHFKL